MYAGFGVVEPQVLRAGRTAFGEVGAGVVDVIGQR